MHAISNSNFAYVVELLQVYIADNSARRDVRTVNRVRRALLLLRAFAKSQPYKK